MMGYFIFWKSLKRGVWHLSRNQWLVRVFHPAPKTTTIIIAESDLTPRYQIEASVGLKMFLIDS